MTTMIQDKDGVIGVYDTHCRTDKECPFYKANKNYPNNVQISNKFYVPK